MSLSSYLTLKMPGSDTLITSPSNHSEPNCFLTLTPIRSTSATSSSPELSEVLMGVDGGDCGVGCGVDCGVVDSQGGGVGGGVNVAESGDLSRPRLRDLS